jgi:hypothetical protein
MGVRFGPEYTMAETDVITAAVKKLGEVISSFS